MIRLRLTLWNSLVLGFVLTLLGGAIFFLARARVFGMIDDDLRRRADDVNRNWSKFSRPPPGFGTGDLRNPGFGMDPRLLARLDFERDLGRPRLFRLNGKSMGFAREEVWDRALYERSLRGMTVLGDVAVGGQSVRIISLPLYRDGKPEGVGQIGASLASANETVSLIGRILLTLLPIALGVTTLAGIFLTNRALAPVREIARAAGQIEASNLDGRLEVKGADVFASLATTFNSMLERLDVSFRTLEKTLDAQRRFTADASHELKTPLTVIKTRVGIALRGRAEPERLREHLSTIGETADEMTKLIHDLLFLASADEAELTGRTEHFALAPLVDEVASLFYSDSQVEIVNQLSEDICVDGDRAMIGRVLRNLLENAIRYSPERSIVIIQDLDGELQIIDQGVGIPAHHLPYVFDRFYRADSARDRDSGGTGLGLAICRQIVESHGGKIWLTSMVGVGTTAHVRLPIKA